MNRIFVTLAIASMSFMAATFLIGLSLGDVSNPADVDVQRWATVHRICGMLAAVGVTFVHSIVVTYFIGTSRWCKEVVTTYQLEKEPMVESTQLKRRTFPVAVLSMLTVVGIAALGGAADPAAAMKLQPLGGIGWNHVHLAGAVLGMCWIGYSLIIEWNNIQANGRIIAGIMQEVRRIRMERGLEVEDQSGQLSAVSGQHGA